MTFADQDIYRPLHLLTRTIAAYIVALELFTNEVFYEANSVFYAVKSPFFLRTSSYDQTLFSSASVYKKHRFFLVYSVT